MGAVYDAFIAAALLAMTRRAGKWAVNVDPRPSSLAISNRPP